VAETRTVFDLDAARRRLAELRALDDDSVTAGRTRPRIFRTNLLFQIRAANQQKGKMPEQDFGAGAVFVPNH
jgi:hypothetical protein